MIAPLDEVDDIDGDDLETIYFRPDDIHDHVYAHDDDE